MAKQATDGEQVAGLRPDQFRALRQLEAQRDALQRKIDAYHLVALEMAGHNGQPPDPPDARAPQRPARATPTETLETVLRPLLARKARHRAVDLTATLRAAQVVFSRAQFQGYLRKQGFRAHGRGKAAMWRRATAPS